MKAVVFEQYGDPDVLRLTDIDKPTPKDDEILVKIHATTVSAGDWRMRRPNPLLARLVNGLFRPKRIKILGFELAGEVVDAGKNVTKYAVRDHVFAFAGFKFGAYVQYKCLREDAVVAPMPANMTFEQAAAVPVSAITALRFLRDVAKIKSDQKVLIYGASGGVGTYAVQLAKYYGAEVTGVCSTQNMPLVRKIGADNVIDYTQQDYTKMEERFDVVFDAVAKTSKSAGKKVLAPGGHFVSVHGGKTSKPTAHDLEFLRGLIQADKITAVIDRTYPLEQISQAHEYVEAGHKRGSVVITVDHID